MFNGTEQEVRDRIRQSKELLKLALTLEPQDETIDSEIFKIQKGYLFVSLYSSLEFTLVSVVGRYLELLKQHPKKPMEYQKYILCTILNANFNSVRDCSKKNLWDKKADLFDSLFSDDLALIDDSVLPTDGISISYKQIQDVWKFFHLTGEPLPYGVNILLLNEIKDHRNAIAHGRKKAVEIGARYTPGMLIGKERAIETLCFHILETFKGSYENEEYLNSSAA
jgi:hypothetical protein